MREGAVSSRLCSKQRAVCVAAWHRCQAGKLVGELPLPSLLIQPTLPPTQLPPSLTLQFPWRGC